MRRVGVALAGVIVLLLTVPWWFKALLYLAVPVGAIGSVAVLAAIFLPRGYFGGE